MKIKTSGGNLLWKYKPQEAGCNFSNLRGESVFSPNLKGVFVICPLFSTILHQVAANRARIL